jgi:hypothetical protein
MRRIGIVGLCVVVALALGAAASSAAKVLELSTSAGLIAPGSHLNLGGVNRFETPEGVVECPNGILVASLLSNGAAKDEVGIEGGRSTGTHGVICTTTTALGSVEVKAGGLPWSEQLAANGKALLKGHKKLQLTVTVPSLFGLQCSYEAAKIAETFPLAANGVAAPLEVTVANQAFTRSKTSSTFCPASIAANYSSLPITIEGPAASLLPVFVTRRVASKA